MKFRPCIDIHNGKVKQIVGGSLKDEKEQARENFVSRQDAAWYARLYQRDGLTGGHVILLNKQGSLHYEATRQQALSALRAYPGGLQVGGGITDETAADYLDAGASKVIVTSFVFQDGRIHWENLRKLVRETGKDRLVLDLSCRKREGDYYVVTDRWQKFTSEKLSADLLEELAGFCSEFLIHAVDVEGKAAGIERGVASLLGEWHKLPITYAGGVSSMEDLKALEECGKGYLDVTIGSALDLFGGSLSYEEIKRQFA